MLQIHRAMQLIRLVYLHSEKISIEFERGWGNEESVWVVGWDGVGVEGDPVWQVPNVWLVPLGVGSVWGVGYHPLMGGGVLYMAHLCIQLRWRSNDWDDSRMWKASDATRHSSDNMMQGLKSWCCTGGVHYHVQLSNIPPLAISYDWEMIQICPLHWCRH